MTSSADRVSRAPKPVKQAQHIQTVTPTSGPRWTPNPKPVKRHA